MFRQYTYNQVTQSMGKLLVFYCVRSPRQNRVVLSLLVIDRNCCWWLETTSAQATSEVPVNLNRLQVMQVRDGESRCSGRGFGTVYTCPENHTSRFLWQHPCPRSLNMCW